MGTLASQVPTRRQTVEEVPSPEDFEYKFIEAFNGGLNLFLRPEDVEDNEFIKADGVRIDSNQVLLDLGFKKFGQVTLGTPRAAPAFLRRSGTVENLLITNTTFYKWSASNSEWEYVSDGTSTTLDANEASGQTVISVTSETGFSATDAVGIRLNDGKEHRTTVASTAAGTITIDDALPSAADSGKTFLKTKKLAGDATKGVSYDVYPADDWFIFANGVDTPQRYDGSTVEDIPNLPGSTFICRLVSVFNNHILLLNTTEDGTAKPQRVRNSDTGNGAEWVTGNAGFNDLLEEASHIKAVAPLDPYMMIYKGNSFIRMEWVGEDDKLFNFNSIIVQEGVKAQDDIINMSERHIVNGTSNIWEYKGGFVISPIGSRVKKALFSSTAEMEPNQVSEGFGFHVRELDEIWHFFVKGGDTTPKRMVRYSLPYKAYTFRDYTISITGFGFFEAVGGETWNDEVGDWTEAVGSWLSDAGRAGSPTVLLCSGSPTDQVYEYNFDQPDDDGTDVSYEVQTKDFYIPNRLFRFDRFDFSLKGASITVAYSIDGGDNFVTLTTANPGAMFTRIRIYKQFVSRKIRFKFSGTGGGFGLEWLGFRYKRESIW